MFLTVPSLQCILIPGIVILGDQGHRPYSFQRGSMLCTFVLSLYIWAHIYVLEKTLGPSYETPNYALNFETTRSWCFVCKITACCNLYLCATCFSIIAGSLICWYKPEQEVLCVTLWRNRRMVLTQSKLIWIYWGGHSITCITSFFRKSASSVSSSSVVQYSTVWPAQSCFFFLFLWW